MRLFDRDQNVGRSRHADRGRTPSPRAARVDVLAVLVAIAAIPVPAAARAQKLGWSGSVEASGSVLFGNASDRLFAGRVQLGRADSTLEVRSDARFSYAESTTGEGGRAVTGRTVFASLATDYLPFSRYSPFWFGSAESSLQQQIASRYATGAGGKLTFYERDPDDEASVSLALLAERTQPRRTSATVSDGDVEERWRARWSLRPRWKRRLSKGVRVTHVTFYQPAVNRIARYTINSTSTLAADLTSAIALTVTFHDTYDSDARGRGARRNNDGQLLFGVRAGW